MFKINMFIVIALIAFTSVFNGFCGDEVDTTLDAFKGEKGTIRLSGGTAHIPVLKAAAKRIMTANSDIQISIAGGGSGVGIKQVGEGLVDIGNAGRAATEKEIETYNLVQTKWAIDGVAVVVHPDNAVTNLTSQQLADIFSGKITNWSELGGADAPIALFTRDEASGTRNVFWKKAISKGTITQTANVVHSNGSMKTTIAGNPNAIGYVSAGHVDNTVAAVSLDGVAPTTEEIKSGNYKVARGLYSSTKGAPAGLVAKLLAYLLSPAGQELVVANGFIAVK